MIDLEVDVDTQAARYFVRGVNLKAISAAEVQALNRVIITVRKDAVQQIWNKRRMKKGTIRQQLRITKASRSRHVAQVAASRRPIPLREYSAKLGGGKKNKAVYVNVTGKRKRVDGAFLVEKLGGHVFRRKTDHRLPIKKLFGPSLGSAMVSDVARIALNRTVATRWPIEFTRAVEFRIGKLPRKR